MGEASGETWLHKHGLVITTPRLVLRDEDPEDETCVAALFHIRNDPKALELVPFEPLKDLAESKQLIRTRLQRPHAFNFVIELRESKDKARTIIGTSGGVRTPEFGYWIGSEHWRKGYTIEAMQAVLDVYWDMWPDGIPSLPEQKRHIVELMISPENAGSIAIAKKLGGTKIREKIVDDVRSSNGVATDASKTPFILDVYGIKRPSASERAARNQAYERLEVVGPNLTERPPFDANDSTTT